MTVTYHKCRCGDSACKQYTLSTQGSVGFDLEDARLYAAAPDLLAACIDALEVEEDMAGSPDSELAKQLRAAIAKATGSA
jgi:hypothetical protein